MKINTDKKIYYAVCTTLAVFLALIMIYREIPRGNSIEDKSIQERLIPAEVTAAETLFQKYEIQEAETVSVPGENEALLVTEFVRKSETQEGSDNAVNLNTAGLKELMSLKGIGEKKAESIIEYREANGGFTCVDDLRNISGIGSKTIEAIRDYVTV